VLNSSSLLCSRGAGFRRKGSGDEGLLWSCREKLFLKQARTAQQRPRETIDGRNGPELFLNLRRKKKFS